VSDQGSPAIRRRRLAGELRRLRERAGYTGDQAADRLGWSASKLSRIETDKIGIKEKDVGRLLDLYRLSEPHREELLALARESKQTARISALSARLPEQHAEIINVEAEAESIWNWEPQIVSGLLQTEEYARAVMAGWHSMFTRPPSEIERRVEARLLRQQVLQRDPPPQVSIVMDESVMHRQLGDAPIMRMQLEHIINVSRMPNVRVQILPLKGIHPVVVGAFTYIKYPQLHEIPLNDTVTYEYFSSIGQLDSQDETYEYSVAFKALEENSLTPGQSREELARVAREVWS
jgi:transcriptional regulator with XRE-family HTH domain